jgi:hypothetical protein
MTIKYTKWPQMHLPSGRKIDQIDTNIPTSSITRPSKIYPNWDFRFEKVGTIWQPCVHTLHEGHFYRLRKSPFPLTISGALHTYVVTQPFSYNWVCYVGSDGSGVSSEDYGFSALVFSNLSWSGLLGWRLVWWFISVCT